MAMRNSTRRELWKLRELVHFLLSGAGASNKEHGPIVCFFCKKTLCDASFVEHGNATGPKFLEKLSIHHVDGNHDNNEDSNKALCHTTCHKAYHRRIANLARAQEKAS